MSNTDYNNLLFSLDQFIKKYYKNKLIKGVIISITFLLFVYLLLVIAEYFSGFSTLIRSVLFYSYLFISLFVIIKLVLIPIIQMYKLGKVISYEQASTIIGTHFKQIEDKLLNVLLLNKSTTANNNMLVAAAVQQKSAELKPIDFKQAINLKSNIKYLKIFMLPLLILIFVGFINPLILSKGSQRLLKYSVDFPPEFPYEFIIQNNKLECLEGENLQINILVKGTKRPSDMFIKYNNKEYKLNLIKNSAEYTFFNLKNNVFFELTDGKNTINSALIHVFVKPKITNYTLQLNYPAYLNKPNEMVINNADVIIPEGTQIYWKYYTKNVDSLSLHFPSDSIVYKLQNSNNNSFEVKATPKNSNHYYTVLYNTTSNSYDSIKNYLQIIPDQYPTISLQQQTDSLLKDIFYFNGTIQDDYGLSALLFKIIVRNEENEITDQTSENININAKILTQNYVHIFNLADWKHKPSHTLEFYFEVWDNDAIHGKKSTKSTSTIIKIPSLNEILKQKEELASTIKEDINQSIKEAKEVQNELEQLWKQLANKKNISWEEKKKMDNLLQRQKQLQKQLQEDLNTNKELLKEQENQTQNKVLLEKQQQIQEMFEKLVSDDMKKMMEEIQKLMEELNKNNSDEKAQELKLQNEDIEKELNRTMELFKQLEVEQKLENNINKLDELTKQQEELNKELEKSNLNDPKSQELTKQQEELNKKFDELKNDMSELHKLNEELEFKNEIPDTKNTEENISKEMNDAKQNMQNKNKKASSQSQKNATQKMKEMKDQLQQAQQEMQDESAEENLEDMRQLMENLVKFSFSQEDLMKEMKKTSINDPKYTAQIQQQKKLKDDAKMIQDSLYSLSKRVAQIQPVINKEMSAINENLSNTLEVLSKRQTYEANSRQQYIMTAANNLALLFDEIVQQMQQQMSQQKFGDQSCNKPGSKGKPKMSDARKSQQQLSQQLEKLKQELSKQKGGEQGGQNGSKMSKELAKMAAEQEALRRQIQEMMQDMSGEGKKAGGELKKIAEMMEETERDIVNKRITQETINRQKDILTRLLESERAERERDQDDQRESKESNYDEKRNLLEEYKYKVKKQNMVDVLEIVPPNMNNYYKQKVNTYFNNLAD